MNAPRRLTLWIACLLAVAAIPAAAAEPSLYERLGGEPLLASVVGEVIDGVAADPRVNQSFDEVDLNKLKEEIIAQFCSLTDGPCRYEGDDMKTSHDGLGISEAEFYALVEALRLALDRRQVATREKNELLRLLAPMKRDVVTG